MTPSDEEDEFLARFLESEVLSQSSDREEEDEGGDDEREAKRRRVEEVEAKREKKAEEEVTEERKGDANMGHSPDRVVTKSIETGIFSKIPPELFPHILKFLSSEDLVSCSLVCRFLNCAASDESLWRRLYCMRWGLMPPTQKLRESAWKKLYIQRDEEDMIDLVRKSPPEFKHYYIQMQAAKRSQAPNPSQVKDDRIILDKTVLEQVSMWKKNKGLTDKLVTGHDCSGERCSYHQIDDVFVCEETGKVHVCDENCREVVMDPDSELLVCTVSGRCFDQLLLPSDTEGDQEQGGVTDEAEPFMGSGRFARAYLLGYNCADERELRHALRFC